MAEEYKCPICWAKKPTSPIIHQYSIMKKYNKRNLLRHIEFKHKRRNDAILVDEWEKNGKIIEEWSPP